MLQEFHDKTDKKKPGQTELEKILYAAVASFDRVYCYLDALDECPEENGARQRILEGVERLLRHMPNVHLITTSRNKLGIRAFMERMDFRSVCLTSQVVDPDIRLYVLKQLSFVPKLARLDPKTKQLVEEALTSRASGM